MLEERQMRTTIYFGLPALIFMAFIFLYPVFGVFWQSVHTIEGVFTWAEYEKIVGSRLFSKVLWNTLEISFMATVLTFFWPIRSLITWRDIGKT
jgi:ABC-type spermidine/putrescine transport system permease subunit I